MDRHARKPHQMAFCRHGTPEALSNAYLPHGMPESQYPRGFQRGAVLSASTMRTVCTLTVVTRAMPFD